MEKQENEMLFHEIPQEQKTLLLYIPEITEKDTKVQKNITG